MNKCYIVGAGNNFGTIFYKEPGDFVIAADGGVKTLEKLNIEPDTIMGDFDSLGYTPAGENVIVHPVEKDDTDMMLAVKYAIKKGYRNIQLFGGTGGRIDHTIANIQTMYWAARKGINIKMSDDKNDYWVINSSSIEIDCREGKDLSVFAIGGRAKNVTIKGGKYECENYTLTSDNPTAVSNSFEKKPVNINVESGALLIIAGK